MSRFNRPWPDAEICRQSATDDDDDDENDNGGDTRWSSAARQIGSKEIKCKSK